MPVNQVIIGRHPDTHDAPDYGYIDAGELRAGVFANPGGGHIWLAKAGIKAGKWTTTNGALRIVLFDAHGGLNARLGYTAQLTADALLNNDTGASGGEWFEDVVLAVSDNGPSTKGTLLPSAHALGIGFNAITAAVSHGMAASGRPGVSGNVQFYDRSSGSTPPTDFGNVNGFVAGQIAAYAIGYTNEEPRIPVNRLHGSPGNMTAGATIDTLRPSFEADFRDRNGAYGPGNSGYDSGDQVKRSRIRLYVGNSPTPFWDSTIAATSSERANNRTSRQYPASGVTTLSRGVEYQWEIAHQDQADAWGEFSSRLSFTIATAGSLTVTGPTGVQQSLTPAIAGRWTHATGLAMKTLRGRVKQGSVVVQTGSPVSKTVSSSSPPGTLFSTSFAELGLSPLDWDGNYQIELMATDTDDTPTTWAAGAVFTTDSPPAIPTNLSPASGVLTTLPVIASFDMSDPDDDPDSGLTGSLVIGHDPAMVNPSFTSSITGWTAAAASAGMTRTFSHETSVVADGDGGAAKIVVSGNTSGGSAYVWADDELPVVPDANLTLRAWLRTTATALHHRLAIAWYDDTDTLLGTDDEPDWTPAANTWVRRDFTATAPADAVYAKVGVRAYAASGGTTGTVCLDGVDPFWEVVRDAALEDLTGKWEHELTDADFPAFGIYTLSAYGFDGTLYSGGVTDEDEVVRSDVVTIEYTDGPDVTITSHSSSDVIDTVRPLIEYDAPDQVRRNVEIYDVATGIRVRRSGWQVTQAKSYRPSAGYLHDAGVYRFVVTVEDAGGIQGTAEVTNILVTIERPPALENVEAVAVTIGDEPQPSAIQLSWGQTDQDISEWRKYLLYRSDLTDPLDEVTSPTGTQYTDYLPRSGTTYTYQVSQVTEVDGTARESERVEVSATFTFEGIVLCNANDPTAERLMAEAWTDRGWSTDGTESSHTVWDAEAPFTVRTDAAWFNYQAVIPVIDYDDVLAANQEAAIRTLNRLGGPICYRDTLGRCDFVSIPRVGGVGSKDGRGGRRDITIKFRSEEFTEGLQDAGDVI